MQDLKETFSQPGAEWRGKPFWSWNGVLDARELLRQIDIMEKIGKLKKRG